MKGRAKNRIAEQRQARRMTQQELADAVGAHWITISKLERGRMKLTTEWLDKLAAPLGVRPRDLLPDVDLEFRLTEPERIYSARKLAVLKMPPVWLTIKDDTRAPFLRAGDEVQLVPLVSLGAREQKRADGRLAFAGPKNDSAFGFLHRGERLGSYALLWFGNLVLNDIKASTVYLVATIAFQLDRARELRDDPDQQKLLD